MLCLAQGLAQRKLSSPLPHTVPSELTQLQSQALYFPAPRGSSGICVHVYWLDTIIVDWLMPPPLDTLRGTLATQACNQQTLLVA